MYLDTKATREALDRMVARSQQVVRDHQAQIEADPAAIGSRWNGLKITLCKCDTPFFDHEKAVMTPPPWGTPWTRMHATGQLASPTTGDLDSLGWEITGTNMLHDRTCPSIRDAPVVEY